MTKKLRLWLPEGIEKAERYTRRGLEAHAIFLATELQRAYEMGRQHANERGRETVTRLLSEDEAERIQAGAEGDMILRAVKMLGQEWVEFDVGPSLPTEPYTVPLLDDETEQAVQLALQGVTDPVIVARVCSLLLDLREMAGQEVQKTDEPGINTHHGVDAFAYMTWSRAVQEIQRVLLAWIGLTERDYDWEED